MSISGSRIFLSQNQAPIAVNDTFLLVSNCKNNQLTGNVLSNDYDPEGDGFSLTFIQIKRAIDFTMKSDGTFSYLNSNGFEGVLNFTYKICETGNSENCDEANLVIIVKHDNDCDGVSDDLDVDDDNDGILDIDDGLTFDSDSDGILNCFDIDSDNDGIVDNVEAQREGTYIKPLCTDTDGDGWDDAYDPDNNGTYFELADTDGDGTPDFLDTNSDNDQWDDAIEGFDTNSDSIPDTIPVKKDNDNDGLDDAFDTINNGWLNEKNPVGYNAPLPDSNKNGIRNWRDGENDKPGSGNENALRALESKILVYPNPTNGQFNLTIPDELLDPQLMLNFLSLDGKLKYQCKIESSENVINPGFNESGVYMINLKSNLINYTIRLVVNH